MFDAALCYEARAKERQIGSEPQRKVKGGKWVQGSLILVDLERRAMQVLWAESRAVSLG